MDKKLVLLIIITVLIFTSNLGIANAADYRLHVDDQLYISVWGHSNLQQEVVVGPDGMIAFPLVGKVKAEGLSVEELTAVLTEGLQEYVKVKESEVTVALKNYNRLMVTVLGEVNRPGTYQLQESARILDAISLAGGTSQQADLTRIKLRREGQDILVNLEVLLKSEENKDKRLLKDDDIIYVPESTIEVTILGEVKKSGRYKLKKGFHLSDLLAQAGGLTRSAADEAKYISQEEVKKVDLDRLLDGVKEEDLLLHDGAKVYVVEAEYNWPEIFFFFGGLNTMKEFFGF